MMGMSIALYRDKKVKCHNPKRPEKNSQKAFSDMGLNGFIANNVLFKSLLCLTEPKEILVRSISISSVSLFYSSYLPKPKTAVGITAKDVIANMLVRIIIFQPYNITVCCYVSQHGYLIMDIY